MAPAVADAKPDDAMSVYEELRGTAVADDGARLFWTLSRPANIPKIDRIPLFVVVNGLANDSTQWKKYLEAWRPKRPFLYWDYRGHGLSPPAPRPSDITIHSQSR